MKQKDIKHLPVEHEYASLGPGSASASLDGKNVAIDFVNTTRTASLRLAFPAERLGTVIDALQRLQKMLSDPNSPIRRADLSTRH